MSESTRRLARVVGMSIQGRMVDLRDLRVGGEAGGDRARVLALAAHPQGERLQATVGEPGLEGAEHAPDELALMFQRAIVGRTRGDDAGGQVAVPGEVLGRAVDHEVGAQLERTLENGVPKVLSTIRARPRGARISGIARYVGDAQERVGDGLDDDGAGLELGDLLLHRPEVVGVHETRLDAVRAEDLHQQRRRRAVELLRREDRGPARSSAAASAACMAAIPEANANALDLAASGASSETSASSKARTVGLS